MGEEGLTATSRILAEAAYREKRRGATGGAQPVESLEQAFDPKIHEAVATVAAPGVEPGTVVCEVRRGWRLGNELLRPAQVEVASLAEVIHRWR